MPVEVSGKESDDVSQSANADREVANLGPNLLYLCASRLKVGSHGLHVSADFAKQVLGVVFGIVSYGSSLDSCLASLNSLPAPSSAIAPGLPSHRTSSLKSAVVRISSSRTSWSHPAILIPARIYAHARPSAGGIKSSDIRRTMARIGRPLPIRFLWRSPFMATFRSR